MYKKKYNLINIINSNVANIIGDFIILMLTIHRFCFFSRFNS